MGLHIQIYESGTISNDMDLITNILALNNNFDNPNTPPQFYQAQPVKNIFNP